MCVAKSPGSIPIMYMHPHLWEKKIGSCGTPNVMNNYQVRTPGPASHRRSMKHQMRQRRNGCHRKSVPNGYATPPLPEMPMNSHSPRKIAGKNESKLVCSLQLSRCFMVSLRCFMNFHDIMALVDLYWAIDGTSHWNPQPPQLPILTFFGR